MYPSDLNNTVHKVDRRVEIHDASGSSRWQARVRRRKGEKHFTGREDATSSSLETSN